VANAPILVAVDFSRGSEAALAWAVDAAIAFEAPLIVLHVVHDPAEAPGYYVPRDGRLEEIERVAQDMMEEFVRDARKRLPRFEDVHRVETEVVVGLPVTRILEVAKRRGARLIAMGAQGRTALGDVLLGSKVERVTRLSPIPVTVVKTGPHPEPPSAANE
jgi:nucleotide-binding universal stress UspA family protein